MSYACGKFIYGVPISEAVDKWFADNAIAEPSDLGFETMYSAGGSITPGFIGVELGGVDEATEAVRFDIGKGTVATGQTIDKVTETFSLVPTDKQKVEAEAKIAKLPDGLRAVLPPIGVYMVWYSS